MADAQNCRKSRDSVRAILRVALLLAAAISFGGLSRSLAAPDGPTASVQSNARDATQSNSRTSGSDAHSTNDSGTTAAGLCGPNICDDPDCSNAVKCAANCFGNPTCASQCGGSRCNVGCNPGVCGSNCPQECNPATCPQNICDTACGDPDCKVACGGNPCNSGCPDRCDLGLCPANALCVTSCGGSPCNAGCNPGVCGPGCPQECSKALCLVNTICLSHCGGDECNISCTPCASGCPLECDPVVCPANLEGCVWDLLNNVSSRVDSTLNRATEARDRALEARDHAIDLVDNMQDGLQNLTTEMRDWIADAIAALQQAILAELAGAEEFFDGPNSCSLECEEFRADLIALLTSVEDISNTVLSTAGINGQIDLSGEIDSVEALNGKALYPLYRALQALPVFDQEFLTMMSGLAADLELVAPIINDSPIARGEIPDVCALLAENEQLADNVISAAQKIEKVSKGLKVTGAKLAAIGKSKIAGRAGVWGWAGVSYTGGALERFGGHLESLGKRLSPIADKVEKKLQYCVLRVNTESIIGAVDANHQEFMDGDQAILDALKAISPHHGGDLNDDGLINLDDYSLFQNAFGSGGE